jgi:glycosyltransferase involved in cell wall biosynthesis
MRIALVTNVCTHYRRPLFERISQRFDTDLYLTSSGREWYSAGGPEPSSAGLDAIVQPHALPLARALQRGRYDCVVTSLVGRGTMAATLAGARMGGGALVVWVGIWRHPATAFHHISRPVARKIYRAADALLVYGPHVAGHITRESGRTEGIFELPQAVDETAFRARVEPERLKELRRSLDLNGEPVACFVGRLESGKGIDVLVRALARTSVEQRLLIVGRGSLEQESRRLVRTLGVEDKVRFAGPVSQELLPVYLQASDLLVLPSVTTRRFREPWGLVVNEAMASGLPVIATDAVGASAGGLVVDGETGRIVAEGDPDALAAAMDELARDDVRRRSLGAGASEHVTRWNLDSAADAMESAILAAVRTRRYARARVARA